MTPSPSRHRHERTDLRQRPDIVWRLGPDRVVVPRVGERAGDAVAERAGEAAFVWIVLNESGTRDEIIPRGLIGPVPRDGYAAIEQLVGTWWIFRAAC